MNRLYVQLGRTGDIINLLPLLWADAQKGERPRLMVAYEYAPLLEGVTYVEPVIFSGAAHELDRALDEAEKLDPDYICTQINGPIETVQDRVYARAKRRKAMTTSWAKEQWALAGRLNEWGEYPLVFDNRNPDREGELFERCHIGRRKFVLLATEGISSPFPHAELLRALLEDRKMLLIDLAELRAERFYDLLALYQQAHALVAIDSAPLHLANATMGLPVFALVNDKPLIWNGSPWRGNHIWYCRYSKFLARAAELWPMVRDYKRPTASVTLHVYSGLKDPAPIPAPNLYWKSFPIVPELMGRLGPTDTEQYPFVKDVIKMAIQKAPRGMICLSRPGIKFAPNAEEILSMNSPCYAYRTQGEQFSPVIELFYATAAAWKELLPQIPNLFLANDVFWTQTLWALFKTLGAKDVTGVVTREPAAAKAPPVQLSKSTEANQAARAVCFGTHKIYSRYPKVSEQVATVALELEKLFPNGYNPSIIEIPQGMFMAYRYHFDEGKQTRLALARVTAAGGVEWNRELLTHPDNTLDDPRLFSRKECLLASWVSATWPRVPSSAVVEYGQLKGGEILRFFPRLQYGKNDHTALEKNWVFWCTKDGDLRVMYTTSPDQVVYESETSYVTPGPKWAYGTPRGGTSPIYRDGQYLRFFHSSLRNEYEGVSHRYYVGAYLMDTMPPYTVRAVSRKPIIYGSEIDDLKVSARPHHWLANVVFPAGVVTTPKGYLLSLGVNDAQCTLAELTDKDLHL